MSHTLFLASLLRLAAVLTILSLPLVGCHASRAHGKEVGGSIESLGETEIELAVLMGEMQRHSAKLGYAISGRNMPLVEFYLHEVEEVLEELTTVEDYEGMPIAHPAKVILWTALEALEESLALSPTAESIDWSAAWAGYEGTIEACNRCHMATEHGFIKILPATGQPPFNQSFAAEAATAHP